jgi:hypothetical protein
MKKLDDSLLMQLKILKNINHEKKTKKKYKNKNI